MGDRIIFDDLFALKYVPDQYKTEHICDCLATLKIAPDWLFTSKMIEKLFTALYTNENILFFHEDSSNVVFICNGMGILNIDLSNINLDDTNLDEDTIINVRLLLAMLNLKNAKHIKEN